MNKICVIRLVITLLLVFVATGCDSGAIPVMTNTEDVIDVTPDTAISDVDDVGPDKAEVLVELPLEEVFSDVGTDDVANVPLDTSITSHPGSVTNHTEASFEFECNEPACTFKCRLGEGQLENCTSPKTYTELSSGIYTFYVKAIDAEGNEDKTPAAYSWTIDLTKPETTIILVPPSHTNVTQATFMFECTETGCTFECNLDSAGFSPCSFIKTYVGLSVESHTLEVRATDVVGNTDDSPASYTWIVDTTAPDTTITDKPANMTSNITASFEFSCTGEVSCAYQCRLDTGDYEPCTSPKEYTDLADGNHTFFVKAIDAAGNADPSPAGHAWGVDSNTPDTLIISKPANLTNSIEASFEFSCSEANCIFTCKLDDGAYQACTSPQDYATLGAGGHTFHVKAVDVAGNEDTTPASYSWTIDVTKPQTTITQKPQSYTNALQATFMFECSETVCSFECNLDSAGFAPCSFIKTYTGLQVGSHTLEARATDASGNTDDSPASYTWTIDLTLPIVIISTKPPVRTNSITAEFAFGCGETCTIECRLDSDDYENCPTGTATYADLFAGLHKFYVKAIDQAGNVSAVVSYQWTIDLTPPDTTITSRPLRLSSSQDAEFTFSCTEPPCTFMCEFDSGDEEPCVSPKQVSELSSGKHILSVKAIDQAGNPDPSPATYEWWIVLNPNKVDAGSGHTCAIEADGSLWCWGSNWSGQLGIGSQDNKNTPTQVGTDVDWFTVSASAGSYYVCAIKTDGTLWCWGDNMQGQLGLGDTTPRTMPTKVGSDVYWLSVSAGNHTCAVKTNNTLWCWGSNDSGELGIGSLGDNQNTPVQVDSGIDWLSVSAGIQHTCAVKASGTLWCWGVGFLGSGYLGTRNTPIQVGSDIDWLSVSAGYYHTCAVKTGGTLWCWGDNSMGQLGLGYVSSWGDSITNPAMVTSDMNYWFSVSADGQDTCGIKTDGTLWCWGTNNYGQLGLGNTNSPVSAPTQVETDIDWISVSVGAGGGHTCAVKTDGILWCWGNNGDGQLGLGDTIQRTTPTEVGFDTN